MDAKKKANFFLFCLVSFFCRFSFFFSGLPGGGLPGFLIFLCFFGSHFFVLKTSKNAMKHMILPMMVDVISDHFLMLWFLKDSLDTFAFRTFRT